MLTKLIVALILLLPAVCNGASAEMIRGLDTLAEISKEEAPALSSTGRVYLHIDGVQLPYDEVSNTYFIPQSADSTSFEGTVELKTTAGWDYYLMRGAEGDKQQAIENSIGYTVFGISGDQYVSSKIIFTSLPVLCLETDSDDLPGEEDEEGWLHYFSVVNGKIKMDETPIEINLRGNTSKRLPKKSYRVKIVDDEGRKQDLSIAGLRNDDDWILNPMYADTSKIRERLGYDLWSLMNSSGQVANSSRLEYAEVFINGEYWGLYGVQERVDRKQVNADRNSGILYKIAANDRPTVEELLSCESIELCKGIELEFAGEAVKEPWKPAASYLSVLNGTGTIGSAYLSTQNVIDFGLWAMLTQAHDCHFKNQFLHSVHGLTGQTMYKIPWDLNNTFGDVWDNESPETNYTDYRIGKLVYDGSFSLLTESGDEAIYEAIRNRWAELRSGSIQPENILSSAEEIYKYIYPAIQRDSRRWPECGMGEGNAANIRDIESFLETTILRMDEYIENLRLTDTEA